MRRIELRVTQADAKFFRQVSVKNTPKNRIHLFAFFLICSFMFSSCQRAGDDSSKVSISLASDISKKAGALSCTICLKHIGVNVTADDIKAVVQSLKHDDFQQAGTSIDGTIEVLVPPGGNRKISVLGVYMDFTTAQSKIKFYYAEKTVNIEGSEVTVEMLINYLGDFKHSSLVGRYLTGTNTGPTGFVDVKILPTAAADPFIMQRQPIINGWFDFFSSANFPMTYTFQDGTNLFTNITTDGLTVGDQVARAKRPDHHQFQGSWSAAEGQDIVYGFFGPATTASQAVCRDTGGTYPLTRMSTIAVGPANMSFETGGGSPSASTVHLAGGVEDGTGACVNPTLVTQRYSQDRINVNYYQHDGMGNDNARSLEGSFTYVGSSSSDFTKYRAAGHTFAFRTLPGTFEAGGFDGLRLFSTSSLSSSKDLRCEASKLTADGFVEQTIALGGSKISGSDAIFSLSAEPNGSFHYMVCPTKAGALQGAGGMVLQLDGKEYVQSAHIKAVNNNLNDFFGYEMAMSGNTLAVTAKQESSNQATIDNGSTASANNSFGNSGAVYVYLHSGGWNQQAYIKASNVGVSDLFGLGLDLDADTLVVGAPAEDSSQNTITNGATSSPDNTTADAGAAYVYLRIGAAWAQQAYVKAPNVGAGDNFGSSVAIHGDTMVVGAPGEGSNQNFITNGAGASANNSMISSGAVYVFTRNASGDWSQQAYIKAPNPDAGDNFGRSVDINGDTLVVGAKFEASPQSTITNGATASGANGVTAAGAAYVFTRNASGDWSQQAYLKPSNTSAGQLFGSKVVIYEDTIAVGAPGEASNQNTISHGGLASTNTTIANAGAVYLFKRQGVNWSQEAYIKPGNPQNNALFGDDLALYKNRLIVGAVQESAADTFPIAGIGTSADTSATFAGAAYVYHRYGSYWSPINYIKSSTMESNDALGQAVAISNNFIAVGAYKEDSSSTVIQNSSLASSDNTNGDSGAVFIFQEN